MSKVLPTSLILMGINWKVNCTDLGIRYWQLNYIRSHHEGYNPVSLSTIPRSTYSELAESDSHPSTQF